MHTIISIYEGSTEKGIRKFKKMFETLSHKKDALYARVRYNTSKLTDIDAHPLTYPLCIYTNNIVFCLADVTAGYPGTGPHGLIDILKYLDFKFDEDEILENKDLVQLDIVKSIALRNEFKQYVLNPKYYGMSPFF